MARDVIAGSTAKWDADYAKCRPGIHAGTFNSTDLCEVQDRQYAAGRRDAVLTHSVYGFYVRSATGLDGFAILAGTRQRGGPLDGSLAAAVAWGKKWVAEDPNNRIFHNGTDEETS